MISLMKLLNILSSRYIIIFVGEWGAGKTLSMVAYAYFMLQYRNIKNVISKNPVYYPDLDLNYSALVETGQFEKVDQGTLLLHDELLDDIDRRNSLSPLNKYLSGFSKAYRKLDVQEIGTVQYISMVDERLVQLMQVLISPKWVKKYHKDVKIDTQIRTIKKDFRMKWEITDLKEGRSYTIKIDVSDFLNCYDTKYIPNKLAVTHKDYLEWFALTQSKPKIELLTKINEDTIRDSRKEWLEGMETLREWS